MTTDIELAVLRSRLICHETATPTPPTGLARSGGQESGRVVEHFDRAMSACGWTVVRGPRPAPDRASPASRVRLPGPARGAGACAEVRRVGGPARPVRGGVARLARVSWSRTVERIT